MGRKSILHLGLVAVEDRKQEGVFSSHHTTLHQSSRKKLAKSCATFVTLHRRKTGIQIGLFFNFSLHLYTVFFYGPSLLMEYVWGSRQAYGLQVDSLSESRTEILPLGFDFDELVRGRLRMVERSLLHILG